MANDFFRFKKFVVNHQHCAMKVNTDGCLLGAWAQTEFPKNILDIGTGSGVIALMLAQKYDSAQTDAVEIDPVCASQCQLNFRQSIFSDVLQSHQTAIQQFETEKKYHLIASNPPFFANDLQNLKAAKATARHQISLTTADLFFHVARLLAPTGVFCEIIPTQILKDVLYCATENGLYLQKEVAIKALPHKPVGRHLLQFGFEKINCGKSEICIYDKPKTYSQTFAQLLKPYYLHL